MAGCTSQAATSAIAPETSATPDTSVPRGKCVHASLSSGDSPADYVRHYIACLNNGTQEAAQQYWVDVGLPKRGTTATFHPTQHQCRVNRDSFGMGTNAYRFLVAVPGRYSDTSPSGKTTQYTDAVFILLRGTRQQPWAILERTDSASDEVQGGC
jgi:hypothetical protein